MHVPRFSRACFLSQPWRVLDCNKLWITMTMPIDTAPEKLQAEVRRRMRLSATKRKSGDHVRRLRVFTCCARTKERMSQLTCESMCMLVQAKIHLHDSQSKYSRRITAAKHSELGRTGEVNPSNWQTSSLRWSTIRRIDISHAVRNVPLPLGRGHIPALDLC